MLLNHKKERKKKNSIIMGAHATANDSTPPFFSKFSGRPRSMSVCGSFFIWFSGLPLPQHVRTALMKLAISA
jgi:hypothetical protein